MMNVSWESITSNVIIFGKHILKLSFLYTFLTVPACQNINTEAQCYVSDPSCPTQASTDNLSNYNFTSTFTYLPQITTEEIKNLTESNIGETDSHIALSYILIMVVLIAVIAITCFCKRKKEKDKLKRRGKHYEK